MIRDGFKRIAQLIRWGGTAFSLYCFGWMIYGYFAWGSDSVTVENVLLSLTPIAIGWIVAWVIDGFVQKPSEP